MAIPPLIVRLYADSSGLKAGLSQSVAQTKAATTAMETQYQGFGKRVKTVQASNIASTNKFTQGLKANAGLIKLALGTAVVAGVATAVKAAGDLGEAINANNVIFKGSAGVVESWAKTAATSTGLAQAEAMQAAAGFGAMLDTAGFVSSEAANMSVALTQLAGDMGSLHNQDPTAMLERIRSGLSGELEPLRRFGVDLSAAAVEAEAFRSGIAKVGDELSLAQKVQARYSIIMKQTASAHGDFAETVGGSLPNQIRQLRAQAINLAASLGKVLLPAITFVFKAVNAIIGPLTAFIDLMFNSVSPTEAATAALQEYGYTAEQARKAVEGTVDTAEKSGAAATSQRFAFVASTNALAGLTREAQRNAEVANGWAMRQKALQSAMDGTTETFVGFMGMTQDAQRTWAKKIREGFDGVGTAFDNLAGKAKLTAGKIIAEFRRQADNLRNYNQNLQAVADRNIPDVLLEQLIGMGTEGAAIMAQLAGAGKREFKKIVDAMMSVPKQEGAVAATLQRLRAKAEALAGEYTIRINVTGGEGLNAAGFHLGQRAHGGPVAAMRPYIVGERGPELFVPKTSGTIVPNDQVTSGDTIIPIYLGDEVLERVVVKGLNRAAARL